MSGDGENSGLVIAEIELVSEDAAVELPPWLGDEVTGDRRYYAASVWRCGRSDRGLEAAGRGEGRQ